MEKHNRLLFMRFHGIAELICVLKTLPFVTIFNLIKYASTLTGFSFAQPPTGREYAGRTG